MSSTPQAPTQDHGICLHIRDPLLQIQVIFIRFGTAEKNQTSSLSKPGPGTQGRLSILGLIRQEAVLNESPERPFFGRQQKHICKMRDAKQRASHSNKVDCAFSPSPIHSLPLTISRVICDARVFFERQEERTYFYAYIKLSFLEQLLKEGHQDRFGVQPPASCDDADELDKLGIYRKR